MFSKYFKIRQVVTFFRYYTNAKSKKVKTLYFRNIHFFFKRNLFLINSISSGACMGLGDMIHQEYEYRTHVISERYEWGRIKRMFAVGTILGSLHHYYYLYLDIILPKRSFISVFQKMAADQLFCSPLTIVLFFYLMGLLEMKNLLECTEELNHKFKMVYIGDWVFWPPVQFVNFYFLPPMYRVFYINIATMVFDVFLSLMKHYDQHGSK